MPLAATRRQPLSLRRRARSVLTERLGYKAAALFFALVLWVAVSAEEPAEEIVPVRLAVLTDSGVALAGSGPAVRALVVGRGRELLKLYSSPPVVRRVFTAGVPESVRVEIRPADVELPSGVDAAVRDVQPRAVTLHFLLPALAVPQVAFPSVLPESALRAALRRPPPAASRGDTLRGDSLRRDSARTGILLRPRTTRPRSARPDSGRRGAP